jgi:GxxExxY protein
MREELLHKDITDKIIKAFYRVYNTLGSGFLEKVYERALVIELRAAGLQVDQQRPIKVYYGSHLIGDYYADILVNGVVIVELKAAEVICEAHLSQLNNYLKATDIEVGLLLNFGPQAEFKRKYLTNDRKALRSQSSFAHSL